VEHLVHGEKTDWLPRSRTILEHGETRPFVRVMAKQYAEAVGPWEAYLKVVRS
jgi:hypothetical protein